MTPHQFESILFAFAAALLAGGLNSVAGGGSFISFPALLLVGLPPIVANATNNTAMWLGTLSSAGGYREEFRAGLRGVVPALLVASLGGAAGAVLLLVTPEQTFSRMIPWLLLLATLLFASSDLLRRAGRGASGARGERSPPNSTRRCSPSRSTAAISAPASASSCSRSSRLRVGRRSIA